MVRTIIFAFVGALIGVLLYFAIPFGWVPLFPILLLAMVSEDSLADVAFNLPGSAVWISVVISFVAVIFLGGLLGFIVERIFSRFWKK